MAIENVRKFEEKIKDDEALQARLKDLSDSFGGDGQDARALFDAVVAPLAAEVGLPHTYDEALEALVQEPDDEDLDVDEAKAVAGGIDAGCFLIGLGSTSANACMDGECGANACAVVGVGGILS